MPFTRFPHGCRPAHTHYATHCRGKKNQSRATHTGELDAAVTALGSSALLLQVKVTELTTRGLDDANLVGPRVVPVEGKKNNRQYIVPKSLAAVPSCSQYRLERRGGIVGGREFFSNVRVPAALERNRVRTFSNTKAIKRMKLTNVSLLFAILSCLILCDGQERRRRSGCEKEMFEVGRVCGFLACSR